MPGLQVFCLPSVFPAGPARPSLTLFLMTGNGRSFPLPFRSQPPHPGSPRSLITSGPSRSSSMRDARVSVSPISVSSPRLVSHTAPKVHGGAACATRVALHFVPGDPQEFLPGFAAASFPPGLERPEVSAGSVDPGLLGGTWRLERGEAQSPATRAWLA